MSGREIMVGGKPLSSLRVVDLKAELDKVGLSKSGSKKELSDRLKNHLVIEREREGAATADAGDEEQLPNISMQNKLAEDNPFIREYFASQAELYHSQKVVKKLYQEEQIRESEGSGTSADEREKSPVKVPRDPQPTPATITASSPVKETGVPQLESVPVLQKEDKNGASDSQPATVAEAPAGPPSPSPPQELAPEGNKTLQQEEPTVSIEKPALEVEKSTVDIETPKVDLEKPTVQERTPVIERSDPEVEPITPAVHLEKPAVNVEEEIVETPKPESDETESSSSSDEEEKSSPEPEKTPDREPEVEAEPAINPSNLQELEKPVGDIQDSHPEPKSAISESRDGDSDLLLVTESSTEELVPPPAKKPAIDKTDKENVQVEKKSRIIPITFDKEDTKVKKGPIRTISFTKTEGKVVIHPTSKRLEIQPPTEEVPLAPSESNVDPGLIRSMSTGSAGSVEGVAAADEDLDYGEEGADDQRADELFSMDDYEYVPIEFEPRLMNIKSNSHSQRRDEARAKAEKENLGLTSWPGERDDDEDFYEVTTDMLLAWYPATNVLKEEEMNLEENPLTPPGSPLIDIDETFRITRTFSTIEMSPTDERADSPEEDLRQRMDTSIQRKVSMVSIGEEAAKELTPPNSAPTPFVMVTNLVRPFTVPQLKELLQRTGNVVDLWVDKIKSKCVAKYDSENEAIETRTALHGVRWPISNPKCLSVDYTTDRVLEDLRRKDSGEPEIKIKEKPEPSQRQVSIREWDMGKRRKSRSPVDRKRSTSRDRKRGRYSRSPPRDKDRRDQSGETKKKPEPSGKALDELFRKTVTTPCIYWLPLTPQQIAEKEEHRRKRMEERERRIAEMQKQQRQR